MIKQITITLRGGGGDYQVQNTSWKQKAGPPTKRKINEKILPSVTQCHPAVPNYSWYQNYEND